MSENAPAPTGPDLARGVAAREVTDRPLLGHVGGPSFGSVRRETTGARSDAAGPIDANRDHRQVPPRSRRLRRGTGRL